MNANVYRSYNIVVDEFIQYDLDPAMFLLKFSHKIWQVSNNYINSLSGVYQQILNTCSTSLPTEENELDLLAIDEENHYNQETYDYYASFCDNQVQSNIFFLKTKGYTNSEIAQYLKIPKRKVEYNLGIIRKKYQINNIYI